MEEIGAINAILSAIKTRVDGSVSITIEANPSEIEVINKLMQSYLIDKRVFTVAFIRVDE
jgi:hypothetical protein